MALTMTRTRTQTALNRLAAMVADIHGELAFLEGLMGAQTASNAAGASEVDTEVVNASQGLERLKARQVVLRYNREALYTTLRQFDASIDPERIGSAEGWKKRLGGRKLGAKALVARYLNALVAQHIV